MKFKISEDKLEQVIFKFLDNKLVVEETKKKYHFFEKGDNDYLNSLIDVVKVADDELETKRGICDIDNKLIRELMSFFSIDEDKSEYVIRNYVQKKLDIKIVSTWISY